MNKKRMQTINYDRIVFIVLAFACIGMVALYMYFVSASIVHVVIRKEVGQDLVRLSSEVSELDSKYIAAQHAMSNQIATLEGYHEIENKIFINRTSANLALSKTIEP